MGIKAPLLCQVVGMEYTRWENRRRRAKACAMTALAEPDAELRAAIDREAFEHLPVTCLASETNSHAYYDAADVLLLAVAVEAERVLKLKFEEGARLAIQADVVTALDHDPAHGDLFAFVAHDADGGARYWTGAAHNSPAASTIGAATINLSALHRRLKKEAARWGADVALGWAEGVPA